jgi:hypothetical protein
LTAPTFPGRSPNGRSPRQNSMNGIAIITNATHRTTKQAIGYHVCMFAGDKGSPAFPCPYCGTIRALRSSSADGTQPDLAG